MYLVTQDRAGLINLDNVLELYYITIYDDVTLEPDTIRYFVTDKWGNDIRIAEYKHTQEHKSLVERIASLVGATDVYYMPEE